jgi:hypothetical protein
MKLPPIIPIIEGMVGALPEGCASLQQGKFPNGEVYVRVLPANAAAAAIEAWGGEDVRYYLWVGTATNVELVSGSFAGHVFPSAQEALREVCQAVFAGRFHETIWRVGRHIVWSTASFQIAGRTCKMTFIHHFSPFFTKKESLRYAPYVW